MGQNAFVSFSIPVDSRVLDLTKAQILVDAGDYEGVKIAVYHLAEDFSRVTGTAPLDVQHHAGTDGIGHSETAIIIGCIESSKLLQGLERAGKVKFGNMKGKWECFSTCVVDAPLEGYERALVIAGSDKRGAIYGVYALSEQIGISPYDFVTLNPSICLSTV